MLVKHDDLKRVPLKDPLRPLRHLRSAIRGIVEYGPLVREVCGDSCASQLLSFLPMAMRFGHEIDEFYLYRLLREPDLATRHDTGTAASRPEAQGGFEAMGGHR